MFEKRFFIVILVILAIGAGGAYLYFYLYPKIDFQKEFEIALILHKKGLNNKSAVLLEKILPLADSPTSEARAKLLLGRSYYVSDPKKGLVVLKEIGENVSYPNLERALAYQYIADAYMLGGRADSRAFFRNTIFSDEQYKSLITDATGKDTDVTMAIWELYKYALKYYPLPVASYRVAEEEIRMQMVKEAEEYLKTGDSFMVNFTDPVIGDIAEGYANWVKGSVLRYLSENEKKTEYSNQADEAFKKALIILDRHEFLYAFHSLWAHFQYAAFLENIYGSSRSEDIESLLSFMQDPEFEKNTGYAATQYGFTKYLIAIGHDDKRPNERPIALLLAKRDRNFAQFLRGLGWEL